VEAETLGQIRSVGMGNDLWREGGRQESGGDRSYNGGGEDGSKENTYSISIK